MSGMTTEGRTRRTTHRRPVATRSLRAAVVRLAALMLLATLVLIVAPGGAALASPAGAGLTLSATGEQPLGPSGPTGQPAGTSVGGSSARPLASAANTPPVITQQPVDASSVEGGSATFEAQASGTPTPTSEWQESTDGGTTYKNLAPGNTLHLSNLSKTENGYKFRAVFKNSVGQATTEAATLHILEAPVVGQQPLDKTVVEGHDATFTSAASGNPAPTVQWELSTDGGTTFSPISGATSPTLTIHPATAEENGYRYRAVFSNEAGSASSNSAKLTVQSAPVIGEQPQSQTVGVGATVTFQAAASGLPAPTVQWELSVNEGSSWTPVSGATSGSLTVTNVQEAESGEEYRAVFKNAAGAATSQPATLTVSSVNYRAYGWGSNSRGQVGIESNEAVIPAPAGIGSLHFVKAVAAGGRHSLALLAGGTVESWGYNAHGQLGVQGAEGIKSPIPVTNLSHVAAIAAGGNHSVALLKNGTVEDWGDDESGQLGNNSKVDSEVPVPVEGLSGVTAVAAGAEHTLALRSDGTVMAWGNNERGQLGTGNTKSSTTPVAVKGLSGVTAIAADRNFDLALLSDGTVVAWGDDERGQLGNATVLERETETTEEEGHFSTSPVPVEGLSGVTAIAAGQKHALALLGDGTVVAWGDDREGELGNGAQEPMSVHPTPVSGLSGVTQIAAGEQDSAAILEAGTLMTWGANNLGSLGTGAAGAAADIPVPVTALGMVAGVSAGGGHMLAFGEQQPAVTGISPSSGAAAGGTKVTITGTNLTGASAVRFGSKAATSFEAVSSTTVKALAPAGTGTVDVTVVTPGGTTATTPGDRFAYLVTPTVTKLSVKGGPATGGTSVTITGTGFAAPAEVRFGEAAAATVTVNSPTSIEAVAPANVSGTVIVTVTTGGGTSTSVKARFKYAPVVESVSPANGPLAGGNTVTVTGAGFAVGTGTTKLKFGRSSKSVQCTTTTSCTAVVPLGKALGTFDVIAQANKAKSTANEGDRYTYE
jgi:hypothetical protein